MEVIKETEDLYNEIIKSEYLYHQALDQDIEKFINNYHNLLINMHTNIDKYNDLLLKFLSNEYFEVNDISQNEGGMISIYDVKTYNFINSDDIIFNILKILLMQTHYINKVFKILNKKYIHSIAFSNLTMNDEDYIPYILKYLNNLIEFKFNHKIIYNESFVRFINDKSFIDDRIKTIDLDYRKVIDEKLDEKAHYILAQIRRNNNNNLSDIDKDYIMEHLLQSGDYADSKSLRTKLYQIYYLNEEPMITKSKFDLNFDVKTILNLINNNK